MIELLTVFTIPDAIERFFVGRITNTLNKQSKLYFYDDKLAS